MSALEVASRVADAFWHGFSAGCAFAGVVLGFVWLYGRVRE